jgi:organic hydroperoxide reductase OsmC/OhrA
MAALDARSLLTHETTLPPNALAPRERATSSEWWAAYVRIRIDPEEMLVAALSNCHMLSFLHVARLAGFAVVAYRDHAERVMEEIAPGKHAVTKVALHPQIEWIGEAPDETKGEHMHHEAHEVCFIANSVKTQVTVA